MLHLAENGECDGLATLDRGVAESAGHAAPLAEAG
jgi:hypothetical protein